MLKAEGTPATGAKPASMSVGVQVTKLDPVPGSRIEGKIDFRFQIKPNFVYLSGSLGRTVLGPFSVLDGVTVVVDAEVKLKIEAGLSAEFITTLLRKSSAIATEVLEALEAGAARALNRLAGGAAEDATVEGSLEAILSRLVAGPAVAAAIVGWFTAGAALALGFSAGFAAVVNACVAEAEARTLIFAQRGGAAGRLTVEIFANDKTTVTAHAEHAAEYLKLAGGSATQSAFFVGDDYVRKHVDALRGSKSLDDHRKQWLEKYAKGANAADYDLVSGAVFRELGGLVTAERSLEADVQQL
jgi:hypothetical protein